MSLVGFVELSSVYTEEVAEGMDIWRELLGCVPSEPETVDEDEQVTRTDSTCADGSEVVRYDIEGMGHRWPEERLDGIDATEVMWEFFADHARSE